MISEQERLNAYHPFNADVTEMVAEVAERQRAQSWDSISNSLPAVKRFTPKHGGPIDVLDIIPKGDFDGVYVYHTPMALPLDENMIIRVATLSAAEPNKRIIAVGNPSSPGNNGGKLRGTELSAVWLGNMRPTIEPACEYLIEQGLEHTVQIGYSYGADKAMAAAEHASSYDLKVDEGVFMEPASIKSRGLPRLVRDFLSSGAALDGYVKAADSKPLFEARKLAEKRGHGFPGYILGLMRMSNIAIAHTLSKDGFEASAVGALLGQNLSRHPMRANIIWGTASELSTHNIMLGITQRLRYKFGESRVKDTVIEGGKHAMGDDIFLHTALVLQSLK